MPNSMALSQWFRQVIGNGVKDIIKTPANHHSIIWPEIQSDDHLCLTTKQITKVIKLVITSPIWALIGQCTSDAFKWRV